jgi:HK97 family phage prohead protease
VPTTFEVRSQGNAITFEGYALKWMQRSQNLGGFREQVALGATNDSIGSDDIRALFNHDPNLILGRSAPGVSQTLELSNDETGTYYRVQMPDTTYARDLAESMQRGDVTQSSFAFRTIEDDWDLDEDDTPLRTLVKISLADVSPVTYPAYTTSTSGVGAQRALERALEARGLSVDLNDEEAVKAALRGDVDTTDHAVDLAPYITADRLRSIDIDALALRASRL